MATSKTRKRSQERRTATKEDKTPKAPAEPQAPTEVKPEELVALQIEEEHLRIYDVETGEQVEDSVSYLMSLRDRAIKYAKSARSFIIKEREATAACSDAMLAIRRSIIMPADGMPDWGGVTKVYKTLATPIIDAATAPGESRATVVNRLQRSTRRKLEVAVAQHANIVSGLNLPDDEVQRIVSLGDNAVEGDEAKNEQTQKLVAAVNEQFRVGDKKRPDNFPESPFVSKDKGDRGTPAKGEAQAIEARASLPSFRNSVANLTADAYLPELVLLAQTIYGRLTSKTPAFGDAGKQGAVGFLSHTEAIIHALGKELDGQDLSKHEREAKEKALAYNPPK